jgi:hypothetical protein
MFSQLCSWTIKCSGMLCWRGDKYYCWTAWPWQLRHSSPSKRRELFPHRHSVTSQSPWLSVCTCYRIGMAICSVCWWHSDLAGMLQCRPKHFTGLSVLGGDTTHQATPFRSNLCVYKFIFLQPNATYESMNIFTNGISNIASRILQLIFGENRGNLEGNMCILPVPCLQHVYSNNDSLRSKPSLIRIW